MNTLECQICSIREFKSLIDSLVKPNNTIIRNYDEIKDLCKANEGQILKIFYFYRNNIQDILYESNNVIDIKDLYNEIEFSELFYLSLLLYNSNLVNFYFSFDFIKNIDSIEEENSIKQIILSKIIIILIDYSKGLDYYYKKKNELENIESSNRDIIKRKLEIFNKEFNLKYDIKSFLNTKIDYIYKEIIVSLIKENKFGNNNYYKDKFKKLDLESIDITKTILDGLSEELDIKKNKFLENYMINEDRLEDEKVINFYDILFNFILKKPKYIYINNFLIINRNNFSELLKNNSKKCKFKQFILDSFSSQDNDNTKNLVNYNGFSNSMFWKDIKEFHQNNKEKDLYISISQSETNEIKSKSKIDINKAREILQKLKIIIDIDCNTINKILVIKTLFCYGKNYQKIINYEDDLKDFDFGDKEGKIKDKKIYKKYNQFLDFVEEIKEYISKSKICFNPRIILELKRIELESGDFDMICISTFKKKNLEKKIKFTDKNILSKGISGNNIGFTLLINELSEDDYKGEEYTYNE